MLTFKYPYTNFSEVNLDYVLSKMRETVEAVNAQETTLNGCINDINADKNIIRFTKVNGTSKAVTVSASDSYCVTLTSNTHTVGTVTELDLDETLLCDSDKSVSNIWAALRAGLSVRVRYMLSESMPYWSVPLTLDYGGSRGYFGINAGTNSTGFVRKYFMFEYNSTYDCIEIKRVA